LIERTQTFIDAWADQVLRLDRPVEIILVDWNPPPSAPPLRDVLRVPQLPGLSVRFISVPPEEHSRLSGSDHLSFYQMIAKNVGIRRASGDAILATNIDILLSDRLFLASTERLEDRCLYRADRLDVPFDPAETTDPQRLRQTAPIRMHRKSGTHYPDRGRAYPHVRGIRDLTLTFLANPALFARRTVSWSSNSGLPSWTRYRRAFVQVMVLPMLHLNGCGDFTLMTRSSWQLVHGYPEWEMFSWNLDSLLLYQAAAASFRFIDLPHPAIHLEHSEGWSPEGQDMLFNRLAERGIHVLTNGALVDVAEVIWRGRKRGEWRTNTAQWGLRDREFAEIRLSAA
jgi:hypothetical protein